MYSPVLTIHSQPESWFSRPDIIFTYANFTERLSWSSFLSNWHTCPNISVTWSNSNLFQSLTNNPINRRKNEASRGSGVLFFHITKIFWIHSLQIGKSIKKLLFPEKEKHVNLLYFLIMLKIQSFYGPYLTGVLEVFPYKSHHNLYIYNLALRNAGEFVPVYLVPESETCFSGCVSIRIVWDTPLSSAYMTFVIAYCMLFTYFFVV